jgi:DNA-binding NarL/FixJ family response regulator
MTIRVLVVDDHAVVRAGIRALVSCEDDLEVVDEASEAGQALVLAKQHAPDVAMVDLSLPGPQGVELIGHIRAAVPRTRVLVLSMHTGRALVRAALAAGAHGYVVKGAGLDDLAVAIRTVARGDRFLDPAISEAAEGEDTEGGLPALTAREREVFVRVAEGRTNREIGAELGVSPKTVDVHRSNLMRKLGAHDAQTLTRLAIRHGFLAG